MAPDSLQPCSLIGQHVALVPLAPEHHSGLITAVEDGASYRLWFTSVPAPERMEAEIARRLALQQAGSMLPFTVLDGEGGQIVGMTSLTNIDRVTPRVEIGSTWYAARVQRTALNTEAKLLLLRHAFDTIGCVAVELRTHFLNHTSRRAIERLGAKLDGILRAHSRAANGTLRDSCVYSITAPEWPMVCYHLEWLLAQPRPGRAPAPAHPQEDPHATAH